MRHKRLVLFSSVIALVGASIAVYMYRHQLFPSEQMQSLRQLEQRLDLPEPEHRVEVDTGYKKGWKGVRNYSRHISLSYKETSVLDSLRAKMTEESWQEQPVNSYDPSMLYFKYVKGAGDAMFCVSGYSESENTDGTPLYIKLQASGERDCNPASGI